MEGLNDSLSAVNGRENQSAATNWQAWGFWPAAICTILIISISTRLLSGLRGGLKAADNGAKTVPLLPYWIPIIGHIPSLGLAGDSLLNQARDLYRGGVFALNLGGTTHNILFSPGLATALMHQKGTIADSEGVFKHIMAATFGFPRAESEEYDRAAPDIGACYKHLLSEPSLGNMVQKTVDVLKTNIANLVTFSSSPVDQTAWERTSNVDVVTTGDGEQVVEASFLPLIRDFVAFNANPALTGTDFVNNNPNFFSDLWTMDRGFMSLATGLPRWVPFPPLTRAHIARRRILESCRAFEVALEKKWNGEDPGAEWQDLDNISELLAARMPVYRKHKLSVAARAACEFAVLWAMNANANPLIFWMLNHIYADEALLAALRDEVTPYMRPVQPKQELGVPECARLDGVDQDGLVANCALLKSCYIETLRVDTAPWSFKVVKQDVVLADSRDKTADRFVLRKGTYAHVAHDLHHNNPAYFDNPQEWRADRHVRYEKTDGAATRASADLGTIRPFGGGSSMCKGRAFAQKESLIFAAAIISLWDIEAAGGGGVWKMPKHKKATGTFTTNDDTRVWIRRRRLPEA
ncbi:hypothetical protein MBLNU459_g5477t1 [Dothideomycetes sp. NU459]